MNLNLYKYFYEVAKCGSYTKASEKLLVSQPSLSYSIKALEEQLNVKLFKRKSSKIEITDEGKKIYDKLKIVFDQLDSINEVMNDTTIKTITIGSCLGYYNKILIPAIMQFNDIYPNIHINVEVYHKDNMSKALKTGTVDFIMDDLKYLEGDSNVEHILLRKGQKSVFFAATKYDKFNDLKVDEDYLENNSIYLMPTNGYSKELMDLSTPTAKKKYKKCTSSLMVVNHVKLSPVIGHTVPVLIDEELKNNVLRILPTTIDLPEASSYISIYTKNKNSLTMKFIEFFLNNNNILK